MQYAISGKDAKASDDLTINNGVSATELMSRAAHALFCLADKSLHTKIAVVCGSGNNGGDGYCAAIKLLDGGFDVTIFAKEPKTQAAKHYFDILTAKYPTAIVSIQKMCDLCEFDLVYDCLLGIGFCGTLSAEYVRYVEVINTAKYVISCDIPTGINSENGKKSPVAVKADKTLAIQCCKIGHFLQDAKDCVGEIVVADIGISVIGKKYNVIDNEFAKTLIPARKNNCNKSDFGRCGIIACSHNFVGAGLLAHQSAAAIMGESVMRVGAGYSFLYVPDDMLPAMWGRVTHSCVFGHSAVAKHKLDAVAFGMGIGDNLPLFDKVCDMQCAKVIDADGLNMLSQNMQNMSKLKGSVLTPHPKEFSRLTGVSVEDILDNPICLAEKFAAEHNVVLVLKGASSVITDGSQTFINISGNSALAKGGSGDVLSGVISGLMCQGLSALDACILGTYIAGKTAEIASESAPPHTILPMDIAKAVGDTMCIIAKG